MNSTPLSIAASTNSIKLVVATIILTPNTFPIPTNFSFAFCISFFNSSFVIPVPAITPTPPSLLTAAANSAIDTPIAIPP